MMTGFKKSKKGITLVESVLAVVILSILTIGVLTLLTAGGVKIEKISNESNTYSEAVQKMDLVISAISNGSSDYIVGETTGEVETVSLKLDVLKSTLNLTDVTITAVPDFYDTAIPATKANLRGWYLTLTLNGVTVKAFASNSEGVFDLQ